MDSNFFEYLIIIFFIVSALKSLFGKKKKQQRESEARQRQSAQQPQNRRQSEENPKDILEQLFGLKIPDQSEQTGKQTKIPSDTNTEVLDPSGYHDTSWNPEEEFEDSIGVETVRYENQGYQNRHSKTEYADPTIRKTEEPSTAKKIMGKIPTKMEVENVGGTDKETVQFIERIRNNISNPDSIREYILVSEILNKPRALRR
jgi:hypothetical protein